MVDTVTQNSVIFTIYYTWVCIITNHGKKSPIYWEIKWDIETVNE